MITINVRIVGSVLVFAFLGAFIGHWADTSIGFVLDAPGVVVGVISGSLIGLAFGLLLVHQRRRWIAVTAIAALLLAVFVMGGAVATASALTVAALVFISSAGSLRDLYGGNEWTAIKHHYRIWTSTRGGVSVVSNGRIIAPATARPHLGPKLIIVRPGNAAVMVSNSTTTRICGPSQFMSRDFEHVDDVISLERQQSTMVISNVQTRDVRYITMTLSIIIGIDVSDQTIQGKNASIVLTDGSRGITASEVETLARVPQRWERHIHHYIEGILRSYMARCDSRELDVLNLVDRMKPSIDKECQSMGLRIDRIAASYFSVPLDAQQEQRTAKNGEQGKPMRKTIHIDDLTGQQRQEFHDALCAAYTIEMLTQMVRYHLEVDLHSVASGSNLSSIAAGLIDWAIRTGKLSQLIDGAVKFNPGNPSLNAFVESLL